MLVAVDQAGEQIAAGEIDDPRVPIIAGVSRAAGSTASIRSPLVITAMSGWTGPPVPSINVAPR